MSRILTGQADAHRLSGPLPTDLLSAAIIRYSLMFDRVEIPDSAALSSPGLSNIALPGGAPYSPVPALMHEGIVTIALRDTAASLDELLRLHASRGVQGLIPPSRAKILTAMTRGHSTSYSLEVVAAVFKERVMDFVTNLPAGTGGVPSRLKRDLLDFVGEQSPLLYRDIQLWLDSRATSTSPRSRMLIERGIAAAYEHNVALATGSDFDTMSTAGASPVADQIETIELPENLSLFSSPVTLNALTPQQISLIRNSPAGIAFRQKSEALRSDPAVDWVDLVESLNRLSSVVEGVLQEVRNPATREFVQRERKARRSSQLKIFFGETALLGVGLAGAWGAAASTAAGLLFATAHLVRKSFEPDQAAILSCLDFTNQNPASMVPVASGGVALKLVMADDKSGLRFLIRDDLP